MRNSGMGSIGTICTRHYFNEGILNYGCKSAFILTIAFFALQCIFKELTLSLWKMHVSTGHGISALKKLPTCLTNCRTSSKPSWSLLFILCNARVDFLRAVGFDTLSRALIIRSTEKEKKKLKLWFWQVMITTKSYHITSFVCNQNLWDLNHDGIHYFTTKTIVKSHPTWCLGQSFFKIHFLKSSLKKVRKKIKILAGT